MSLEYFIKNIKSAILPLILIGYALLYIATKKNTCFEDCQKINELNQALLQNRQSYFYGAGRCTYRGQSDTLCVSVKDTLGINWNLFADTVCLLATQKGLLRQKIFILKTGIYPPDTLARKVCP